MPRPHKPRWIGLQPSGVSFVPHPGIPPGPDVAMLTVDELEALRLADAEGLSQEEGAAQMQVSRATFGRIVGRARSKVAHALVTGRPIGIDGGEVRFHPPASGGRHGGGRGAGRGHGRGRRGHGSQHTQGGQ